MDHPSTGARKVQCSKNQVLFPVLKFILFKNNVTVINKIPHFTVLVDNIWPDNYFKNDALSTPIHGNKNTALPEFKLKFQINLNVSVVLEVT